MEEVVFMLQVKRSERGLESRPPSSLVSPDTLLQQQKKKTDVREKEQEKKWRQILRQVMACYRLSVKSFSHLVVSVLALASPSLGTLK